MRLESLKDELPITSASRIEALYRTTTCRRRVNNIIDMNESSVADGTAVGHLLVCGSPSFKRVARHFRCTARTIGTYTHRIENLGRVAHEIQDAYVIYTLDEDLATGIHKYEDGSFF